MTTGPTTGDPRTPRRTLLRAVAAAGAVALLAGCGVADRLPWRREAPSTPAPASSPGASSPASAPDPSVPSAPPGTALAALATLDVAPLRVVDGYSREAFGQRWKDVDRNGCDTRNDILRRDLAATTIDPRTQGCVVRTGTLVDPYTGERVPFVRGPSTSPLVEIDHVVALAAAWRTGASTWPPDRRERFANDPLGLLATSRAANQDKGGLDAAGWLPPLAEARCPFVARQVAVKARWRLTVTPQEKAAMVRVLRSCPAEPLPR